MVKRRGRRCTCLSGARLSAFVFSIEDSAQSDFPVPTFALECFLVTAYHGQTDEFAITAYAGGQLTFGFTIDENIRHDVRKISGWFHPIQVTLTLP